MKPYPLLILAGLCLGASARANDSAFSGVSGTPKPMKGEHHSIAMQSEKIVIVATEKSYDTTVDFVFRNHGGATSVQMGFPESSYGDVSAAKKTVFARFATWVDGQRVPAKRIVTTLGEESTDAYWLKTVTFGPKQTRRIRVAYSSPMGGTTTWGTHSALAYDFTGQNWRGKVERSDLEVRVEKPNLWLGLPVFEGKALPMTLDSTPQRAIFRKTWRNWQAQGDFMFGLTPVVPFWMADKNDIGGGVMPLSWFKNAQTVRVGPVPAQLPKGADAPPAFVRDGTAYISLAHFKRRMEGFADDLEKYRKEKPRVDLKWDAKSGASTLTLGTQSLRFAPNIGSPAPILLHGQYGDGLYVPLVPLAQKLSLTYHLDPKNRLFELARGSWTGK